MNHPDLNWMIREASREISTRSRPLSDHAGRGWSARRAIGRSLILLGTRLAPTLAATEPEPAQTPPQPRTSLA